VPSIREFALPLMVGIVAGAFSSVCLTGPIWYVLRLARDRKEAAAQKAAADAKAAQKITASKKKKKKSAK
jgi:SecD/SecF fusion protein